VSIVPLKDTLKIRQGATVDQSWRFYEPVPNGAISDPTDPAFVGVPTDFTGWTARATLKKDLAVASPAILTLSDGTVSATPAEDVIELGADGLLRIYIRDETTATGSMDVAEFTDVGGGKYQGVMQVELQNTVGERHRYLDLKVVFYAEVTTT
jgi:hypothetical protein